MGAIRDGGDLDQPVVDLLAVGDRPVARHGPGRRGPDQDGGPGKLGQRRADHGKTHRDRRRGMVVVLDLGLGERGLLDHRPHHRFLAAIELAREQELGELAEDPGFGAVVHRGVGIVPVAEHAQALELRALDVDPVQRELAALAAELGRRDGVLVLAGLAVALLDLPLDRQAVAVPARDVDRVLAQHLLAAVDHVLEDLVERGAHVEMAVGVGRAIVEDELLAPPGVLAQPPPEAQLLPARQDLGLARRQVGAHREVGARQEDGLAIVGARRRRGGLVS